jgi:electron transfer flavoprotein alpha subunit
MLMTTLVLVEHDGQRVKRSSLAGIELARRLGGTYFLALLGSGLGAIAPGLQGYGAESVLVMDDAVLAEPLADRYAVALAQLARSVGANCVLGVSSTFTKDVLPRAAAVLDAGMLSDVMSVEIVDGTPRYTRPIQAGSLCATVTLGGDLVVLTARGTAFQAPEAGTGTSPIRAVAVEVSGLPTSMRFVSREAPSSARPDLGEARIVVSGGRPLNDKETFERLIGGLADALGGAVAATRAAVDSGMAPNDLQVGQTGKTIAPELYIGVGVSGAIQHMAGVKDSRIIVAINRDPDAPVFQMATYGLVGDLFQLVPEMTAAARKG